MNVSLAKKIEKITPKHILKPKPKMDTPLPLNNGATIPALGLGTWQSKPGEVQAAVAYAIKAGYRHIDCAYVYGNEKEVGDGLAEGMKSAGVKREELFITTKLWCTYHSRVEENLDESLRRLGLDYVDLYLMHWPVPMNPKGNDPKFPKHPDGSRDLDTTWSYTQTWAEMEKLPSSKVKAIGVANFSVSYLEKLAETSKITPSANQIENHPLLPQQEIVDYCKAKNIHVTAYSPLGSTGSPLFKDEVVQKVAEKHKVGLGTVLLSYHLARGSSVLAKSVTPSRIDENKKLISLDQEDMDELNGISIAKGFTRFVYPEFGVNLGFPDKQ